MDNHNKQSRVDKFEKRRKNTKLLSIMLVVGGILIMLLIGTLLFGGNGSEKSTEEQSSSNDNVTDHSDEEDDGAASNDSKDTDEQSEDQNDEDTEEDDDTDNSDVKTEKMETPNDDNVIEAYKGNWKPIGTDQEGQHTTNYDEGTQDREEMEEAARIGAGLDEGNMIPWRLENGGDQKVIATVSAEDDSQTFRVYLKWVDEEGWQPTKVEVLKENDKK